MIRVSRRREFHAHAHAGDVAKAQAWFERMRGAGIAADAICYNSICSAHAKRGDMPSALATFGAMLSDGVVPSPQTHSIMINALVQTAGSCMRWTAVGIATTRDQRPTCAAGLLRWRRTRRPAGWPRRGRWSRWRRVFACM